MNRITGYCYWHFGCDLTSDIDDAPVPECDMTVLTPALVITGTN